MTLAYKKQAALKLSFERELRVAQLEIQEQTSLHIARELHDNINGYLILAKLNLNTSIPFLCDKTRPKAEDTLQLLDYSLEGIRTLSRSLNPEHMAFDNLVNMLEEYIGWIKKSRRYQVHFTVAGEQCDIEKQKEILLFRILQETISNILKHSHTNTINLSLLYSFDSLKCTISDNGIGFNIKEKPDEGEAINSSSDLQNILRRAKLINAICDIKSSQESGTSISITVPF
jgi:signal transduction histidine kinase